MAAMNRLPGSDGYPNLSITVAPGSDHSAVPIGLAVGRWVWRLMASGLGFADDPSISVVTLLLVGPAALTIACLIASGPACCAAWTRPATILRTE